VIGLKEGSAPKALNPKKWISLKLERKETLSSDTRLFRFALPSPEHELGLPVGQHLFIKAKVNDKPVMRAYTPMGHGTGYVDFVIKVYFANVHPKFPDGGLLTQHMESLQIGDELEFKGPMGEYIFNTEGLGGRLKAETFTHTRSNEQQAYDTLGLIAGGSGITPVLQVANALLKDVSRKIKVMILYANQTASDILCGDQLDKIAKDPRCAVWYTVDRPAEGWKYSSGFIDEKMIREHMPPPAKNTCVFMCGPPPMLKFACIPNLTKVGHAEGNVYSF